MDRDLVRRAAAFLLLKDSKASFAIEGEFPPEIRARNWGKIIGLAGKHHLSIREIEWLQHLVIGSKKLKQMGLRTEEGFIGEHDSETFAPIPDHISARAEDLPELMQGLIDTELLLRDSDYDPVLAASTIAFGFVFIHPLLDGNGRIHRYLIHHILASKGYVKRDMIFPVSASMLNHLSDYQDALEAYSAPRLDLITWAHTENHNVRILNDTMDLYRYYDLTKQAEYLYACVQDTIDHVIPEELNYLRKYDQMTAAINEIVSLPDHKVDLLIKVLRQNEGKLSKTKREKFFEELKDKEVERVEQIYAQQFGAEE
jgi:Fic family protein